MNTTRTYVKLCLALDKSASMLESKAAVIAGTNDFIRTQQDIQRVSESDVEMRMMQFNHTQTWMQSSFTPIQNIVPLTSDSYCPGGRTALYDTLAVMIAEMEREVALMKGGGDVRVYIIIQTDGQDTCSTRITREELRERIEAKIASGWEFVYLGANQDAFRSGGQLGIPAHHSLSYHTSNTMGAMNAVSRAVSSAYTSPASAHTSVEFTPEIRHSILQPPVDCLDPAARCPSPDLSRPQPLQRQDRVTCASASESVEETTGVTLGSAHIGTVHLPHAVAQLPPPPVIVPLGVPTTLEEKTEDPCEVIALTGIVPMVYNCDVVPTHMEPRNDHID